MGTEPGVADPESGYIFGTGAGFEFSGKTGSRAGSGLGMYGIGVSMCVKAWQKWAQSRIRSLNLEVN